MQGRGESSWSHPISQDVFLLLFNKSSIPPPIVSTLLQFPSRLNSIQREGTLSPQGRGRLWSSAPSRCSPDRDSVCLLHVYSGCHHLPLSPGSCRPLQDALNPKGEPAVFSGPASWTQPSYHQAKGRQLSSHRAVQASTLLAGQERVQERGL